MQSTNSPPLMSLQQVDLAFRPNIGVFDLTFDVAEGAILGMIGPSGCGKTTTVRLLAGLLTPTAGNITVLGKNPAHFTPTDREAIGYIPQHFVLYDSLTVAENIHFLSSLYGMTRSQRQKRLAEMLAFVDLTEAQDRLGSKLSGGMQRRLMLAGALMHRPKLLFADEPTAGIDPVLRRRFWDYFRALRDEGRTLLVTTQYVGEAAYCDAVAVMRAGRVLMVETPEGLRRAAMGGEVIELVVEADRALDVMHFLEKHPEVRHVDRVKGTRDELHVLVDHAGAMLPHLLNALHETLPVEIHKAERYQIPFDDVFVKLMEQSEAATAADINTLPVNNHPASEDRHGS